MSKTARMVMKIIGASLAFAAFVCLLLAVGTTERRAAAGGKNA